MPNFRTPLAFLAKEEGMAAKDFLVGSRREA